METRVPVDLRAEPKSISTVIAIILVLATGLLGLSAGLYLLVHLETGMPRKDLHYTAVFLAIFTWPTQLAGALTSVILWKHPDTRSRSRWVEGACWIHASAAVAWVTFLMIADTL